MALAISNPGDTLVEVGANVGTETTGFSDIVGPAGRVLAFEPFPANLMALHATLRLTTHRNVTVFPFALGSRSTRLRFVVPSPDNSGTGHILAADGDRETSGSEPDRSPVIDVDCVTLDSLAPEIGPIHSLFIDAEGAEVTILRGAGETVRRYKPILVLEADSTLLQRGGSDVKSLDLELRKLGYLIFEITRLGLREKIAGSCSPSANWFCVTSDQTDMIKKVRDYLRRCGCMPCISGINPLRRRRAS